MRRVAGRPVAGQVRPGNYRGPLTRWQRVCRRAGPTWKISAETPEGTSLIHQDLAPHELGNGSFGYSTEGPFHVRRGRQFVALSLVTGGWAVAWLYGVFTSSELARSVPASVFILGFGVPVGVYSTCLACIRSPVISLYRDHVQLASAIFPWRKVVLHRDCILSVRLDGVRGDGPDTGTSYARANVVFAVSPDCFAQHHRNRIWSTARDSLLYFPIDNLDLSQGDCFAMIEAYILGGRLRE
jgi:hypothetical protein